MIYCPKALEENYFIRQRMFYQKVTFEISIFSFSMRSLRDRSSFSWHRPYFHDWFLSAWAARWFQLKRCAVIDCSFPSPLAPFQRSIFWCKSNRRNSDQLVVREPPSGWERTNWNPSAVVPHGLILLWRRTRWRREIYIDFDWILCFVISKGHNYFHCEVFMIQQNCFLAKH